MTRKVTYCFEAMPHEVRIIKGIFKAIRKYLTMVDETIVEKILDRIVPMDSQAAYNAEVKKAITKARRDRYNDRNKKR